MASKEEKLRVIKELDEKGLREVRKLKNGNLI